MSLKLAFGFALVALTVSAKTTTLLRYMPTKTKLLQPQQLQTATGEQAINYQNQDSSGFYSYGYSGDSSAKAEYVAVDGSSRGFYAYIDADGQLQTVKYEAGKGQGYTAAGTILPQAQGNSEQLVPMPVKDTPEVEAAKEAHFAAYAKAAALAEQQQDTIEQLRLARKQQRKLKQQQHQQQQQLQDQPDQKKMQANGGDALDENDETGDIDLSEELKEQIMAILMRERALSNAQATRQQIQMQQSGREVELSDKSSYDKESIPKQQDQKIQMEQKARTQGYGSVNQMTETIEKIRSNSGQNSNVVQNIDNILRIRSLHALQDENSYKYFKLADLERAPDATSASDSEPELQPRVLSEIVHVPVNSYYTVLSPSTKYSVNTATVLKNVPRSEAQRLGHSLPISLSSTFQAQRLTFKRV